MTEPTIEQRAVDMGWRSQENFDGDPNNWVDAETYVKRGEEILPLVKAENRRLTKKTDALSAEIQRLTAAMNEQRESMNAFAEANAQELKDRLAEQKRQLTADRRAARREDNDERVEEIEEALEANAEAQAKLKEKPAPTPAPAPQTVQETPEYLAWREANPWYGGDTRVDQAKTAAAQRFATLAASAGKTGAAFFAAVDEAMAEVYPPPAKRRDPTEEGRPSGGSSTSSSGSGFKALPADAQAKAREQSSRFVGANKMFKTEQAWFDYYAKQYNTEAA